MTDIYFNAQGQTHTLRIRVADTKPEERLVYEALIDTTEYVWFEGSADLEVWELIELAVQSFLDYSKNDEVAKLEWRAD